MSVIELFANWGGKGESSDRIKCDQNNSLLLSSQNTGYDSWEVKEKLEIEQLRPLFSS